MVDDSGSNMVFSRSITVLAAQGAHSVAGHQSVVASRVETDVIAEPGTACGSPGTEDAGVAACFKPSVTDNQHFLLMSLFPSSGQWEHKSAILLIAPSKLNREIQLGKRAKSSL